MPKLFWIITLCLPVICHGIDPQTVQAGVSVANAMIKLFSTEKERTRDITAAEEAIRGTTFDLFHEKVSSKLLLGIKLTDFEDVIDRIAKRLGLPNDIKDSILDGKFAAVNQEIIKEFKFTKGDTGDFLFGRVATVRTEENTIDLAYAIYTLKFKLSPRVIEHTKTKKFLWMRKKKVWRETQERNLSIKEKEDLEEYFKKKAIDGFSENYQSSITADSSKVAQHDHAEL